MIPSDPDRVLGFLVSDVSRLMRRVYDRRVEHLGLTRSQWRVLVHLFRRDGVRQTELAQVLEIEKPTLGRLVDQLERKRLVERRIDPTDLRARLLVVSPEARDFIDEMEALADGVRDDALRGLAPADARRLTELLLAVKGNLQAVLADEREPERLEQ
jgi:MarR family transcriptional regulator for hemolysin